MCLCVPHNRALLFPLIYRRTVWGQRRIEEALLPKPIFDREKPVVLGLLAICQQFSDFPLALVAWQPGTGAAVPCLAHDLLWRPRAECGEPGRQERTFNRS